MYFILYFFSPDFIIKHVVNTYPTKATTIVCNYHHKCDSSKGTSKDSKKYPQESDFEKQVKQAKNGHNPSAQYQLAAMYENKEGGAPESIFHAYIWYSIAFANGHERAKNKIDELGDELSKSDINLLDAKRSAVDCISSGYKNCGH